MSLGELRVGSAEAKAGGGLATACRAQCQKGKKHAQDCTAITVLLRPTKADSAAANCFFRSRVTPKLCARDARFDTFSALTAWRPLDDAGELSP